MISLLNPQANERIDLGDFTYLAQTSLLGVSRSLPEMFLTDPAKSQMWIVRGFTLSNPSGQVLSVSGGAALLALRQGAQVSYGMATSDGAATQALDLSSYAAGTYSVYVRFILSADTFDTRTFYRASGGGEEYGQSVSTRLNGAWELAVRNITPGEEWLQIGTVTAPSMALTDTRPLYFEGRVDQGTSSGWGTAQDRDPDRGAHGVTDLQTALAALRQGLEDIKGPGIARWYTDHIVGQTIGFAGAPVASRTQWGDAGFYAQGDASAPSLRFADDGAQLSYARSTGLLTVNGPDVGGQAGSTATALAWRSGPTDEALVRGAFFRPSTTTGAQALDASLSRGVPGSATGGVGFYGASGLMGGAGVGLGYALGAAKPALFVGASGNVGVGLGSAASLLPDDFYALQVMVPASARRYLGFTDGTQSHVLLGYSNGATSPVSSAAYTGGLLNLPSGADLMIAQGGKRTATLSAGSWALGNAGVFAGVVNGATIHAPVVVDSAAGGYTRYAQTSSLVLNNGNFQAIPGGQPWPARLTFASNNAAFYHIDGGSPSLTITDVTNGVDVFNYKYTTKIATFTGAVAAASVSATTVAATAVTATSGNTAAFAYAPNVTHTDTFAGINGCLQLGAPALLAGNGGALGASSVLTSEGYVAMMAVPIRCMQGQKWSNFSGYVSCNAPQAVTCIWSILRYDTLGDADTFIYSGTQNIPANTSGKVQLTTRYSALVNGTPTFLDYIQSEVSTTQQCWYVQLKFSSSASFNAYLKYFTVTLTTPALSPQQQ